MENIYIVVTEFDQRRKSEWNLTPVHSKPDVMTWSSHNRSGTNVQTMEQNKRKSVNAWNRKKRTFTIKAILIIISL
jgi:hypothetical protein